METATGGDAVRETVTAVLADHPVVVGLLFGSQARGEATAASDIDVAVAFEECEPGDPGHLETLLSLDTDLVLALGTGDVDVIDLRSASPALVRAVFADGEVLVGSPADARRLRERLLAQADENPRSPAERLDDAIAAIDDHLA